MASRKSSGRSWIGEYPIVMWLSLVSRWNQKKKRRLEPWVHGKYTSPERLRGLSPGIELLDGLVDAQVQFDELLNLGVYPQFLPPASRFA